MAHDADVVSFKNKGQPQLVIQQNDSEVIFELNFFILTNELQSPRQGLEAKEAFRGGMW
jgi:hypothetical protein